jgi:hypothetical protein
MVFGPDHSKNLMIKITVIDKITSPHLQKFCSENSEYNTKYEISQKSVHWEFKLFHEETD